MSHAVRALGIAALALAPAAASAVGEWSGYAAGEARYFPKEPLDPRQHGNNLSVAVEPEYYLEWDDGNQNIRFVPFYRWDQGDDERTHGDIRELAWWKTADSWELRVGIRKVFWGVTESAHLVDIINQSDLVENVDGEDKLGQPMVNLALVREWGTVDLFVLPYFRERTFPGVEGRPSPRPRVDPDLTTYESSNEERHVDYAARWYHSTGIWDMGLSYFYGTSRDPSFSPAVNAAGELLLAPHYDLISQVGVDMQATIDAWLWKVEAIHRNGQGESYNAVTAGLEYTFFGVAESAADLGLVAEYLYDDRGENFLNPFEDDVFIGLRLTLNDTQSTEALVGGIRDTSGDAVVYRLEASRRIGANWKVDLEARGYSGVQSDDIFYSLRNDSYLQLQLAYYF